ncbi:hypothetical protein F511_08141 [Dorcoceras hygrometricum]|uniref:Uncharacterized protein n=1 Tax=Dorcoceras hygrometricum TaxID=472368 RepID=A0A2Z7B4V9_9LAMI|nr:hypothetical protein F511_08141 [Dorcoceras hygrometricum]
MYHDMNKDVRVATGYSCSGRSVILTASGDKRLSCETCVFAIRDSRFYSWSWFIPAGGAPGGG